MSKVTGTTSATHKVASFTHSEKANTERDVTATELAGPSAGMMTDWLTLPRLPLSLHGLLEDHFILGFLRSLYAELLSQLAGLYASVSQELWKIRGDIDKLTNKLVFLSTDGQGWPNHWNNQNFIGRTQVSLHLFISESGSSIGRISSPGYGPQNGHSDWWSQTL